MDVPRAPSKCFSRRFNLHHGGRYTSAAQRGSAKEGRFEGRRNCIERGGMELTMSRKPQREQVKRAIQLRVNAELPTRVRKKLPACEDGPASLSRLIEDMLFMTRAAYAESPSEDFVRNAYALRARQFMDISRAGAEPELATIHVTIDRDACAFADLLTKRHPRVFPSRSELCALLLYQADIFCATDKQARYFLLRLEETVRVHPRNGPSES